MNKNDCNDTVEYTYVCYISLIDIYIYILYSYNITYHANSV